jgi:hypothetical protein
MSVLTLPIVPAPINTIQQLSEYPLPAAGFGSVLGYIRCRLLFLVFPSVCRPCTVQYYHISESRPYKSVAPHTAKTKYRNFETNIPRKGISGPQAHTFMCLWANYISTLGLPFLLEEICGPILGICKSLTDTWMWKLGLRPRDSQKRNM